MDINDQDALGLSPLHLAAQHNHGAVVKCLLLNGADPELADDAGNTALALARAAGAQAAVRELSEPGVLFWNASVRANKLYNDKVFDAAIQAYSVAIKIATEEAVVRPATRRCCPCGGGTEKGGGEGVSTLQDTPAHGNRDICCLGMSAGCERSCVRYRLLCLGGRVCLFRRARLIATSRRCTTTAPERRSAWACTARPSPTARRH